MKSGSEKQQHLSLRYSNAKGNIIPMHHAFKTLHLGSTSRMSAVVLPVFFGALVWLVLPLMFDVWSDIFGFWMRHMYKGGVGHSAVSILGQELSMPYPLLDAQLPSVLMVRINLAVCLVLFILSLLVSFGGVPLTYFIRAILLIQGSASVDRMLSPDTFPYALKTYMVDVMIQCAYMAFLLPFLLAVVYYIFDFSLWRKCFLTILMMGYFLVTVPCQYMLHAYIIHEGTLLFLPLMYMMFGVLLDVLMFVSMYAFGMSWKSRPAALQGRGIELK